MKLSVASLLLLPGACIVGALIGGSSGVLTALEWWAVIVLAATVGHAVSAVIHRGDHADRRRTNELTGLDAVARGVPASSPSKRRSADCRVR